MLYSITDARGTGDPMLLAVPPYIDKSHIHVYIDGLPTEAFEWVNAQTISTIAPANRLVRVIRRTSQDARLTAYLNGQPLPGDILEVDSRQAFYMAQEALDLASLAGSGGGGGTGAPGVELTTEGIKALLLGQIGPSLLELALREEIGLINAPGSVPNSPRWLVAQEELARAQALIAEAQARADALLQEANQRDAQITETRTALQTDINSVASQVTTLTAGIDGNAAAIQSENTARVDADIALAAHIESVEAQFTDADSATNARITSVQEAVASADNALALRIDTVQSQLGASENLFPGFAFDPAAPGGWNPALLIPSSTAGVPAGAPGVRVLRAPTNQLNSTHQPCEPLSTLDCVIWVARGVPDAGSTGLYLSFYNAAGVEIVHDRAVVNVGLSVSYWQRMSGRVQVPAEAVSFTTLLAISNPSDTYYATPTIEKRPEAFAAVEQSLNTVATKLEGVEANWTIKVQARLDGKNAIAGIGLNATATNNGPAQSQMVFLADQFTFVPSMSDINVIPQPLLVMGLVNGVNTLIVPPSRYGDKLIEARMIIDGGIEARHLKISGGHGQALNLDPGFLDASAFEQIGAVTFVAISDGASGTSAVQMIDSSYVSTKPFKATAGKYYKVSVWGKPYSGAANLYMRAHFYNAAGQELQYQLPDINGGFVYESFTLASGWNQHVGTVQAPPGTVQASISIDSNNLRTGLSRFQDFRCEEMIDYSLIVYGGIKADRIDTRGLEIKDMAGNVILSAGTSLAWSRVVGPQEGANMVLTPTFEGGQSRTWPAPVVPVSGAAWTKSLYCNLRDTIEQNDIPVREGELIYCSADLASRSAYTMSFGVVAFNNAGAQIAFMAAGTVGAGQGFANVGGALSLPAGTVMIRPWIQVGGPGGTDLGYNVATNLYIGRSQKGATYGATFGSTIFGQINAANVSTYIANAAIQAAQVGSLNVGVLSTALNGGSSAGRIVLETNKMSVYDDTNMQRVRVGYLL